MIPVVLAVVIPVGLGVQISVCWAFVIPLVLPVVIPRGFGVQTIIAFVV